MKSMLTALLLGSATLAPLPAFADAVVTAPAPASDADQLVAMLLPEDALVQITQRIFDNAVLNESGFTPEKKKLYADNSGLKPYIVAHVKGELATIMKRDLPGLRTDMAALLTREMSASEIADTLTFFASATGQKMMATMYAGIANSAAASEEEAKQAAMASLMASLTADDYPALMAFGSTPAATKLQAITPKIQDLSKSWAQKMIVANQAQLQASTEKATAEYLAQAKKK
jgi:hypothetical protein